MKVVFRTRGWSGTGWYDPRNILNPSQSYREVVESALSVAVKNTNKWLEDHFIFDFADDPDGLRIGDKCAEFDEFIFSEWQKYKEAIWSLRNVHKYGWSWDYYGFQEYSDFLFLVWKFSELNGKANEWIDLYKDYVEESGNCRWYNVNTCTDDFCEIEDKMSALNMVYRKFGEN